jgi:mono/diheme cytochrome c family protein
MKRPLLALTGMLFLAPLAMGAEPAARELWVKAKCALCHGLDGSGDTDQGKRLATPDLRAPEVQKRTDAELEKGVTGGHARMPSFKKQVDAAKVRLLIAYIRSLGVR